PGDGAEIPDVVGQALQLERDAPDGLRPRRLPAPRQRLDRTAVRGGVSHDRIARDRFGHQHGPIRTRRLQQPLDAAMLVAEHDLEEEYLFTVALKAEVPRLDDAGVHRPDRDLVDLLPLDPEE